MATLAESFLADLEDLSDGEEGDDQLAEEGAAAAEADGGLDDLDAINYDDLESVALLAQSARYKRIMEGVRDSLSATEQNPAERTVGAIEDNPEYKLIVECNSLMGEVDNEIAIIHNFIRDKYRLKFPELESLVMHPIDYARVVQAIGNEMDMTTINLDGLLPSATIMVVVVTGSTTNGKELDADSLAKVLGACQQALELDESKKLLLEFVEGRMQWIAPNLSVCTGAAIAAQLMGLAGGLVALSKMPACNVQILGSKKKRLDGFSTATLQPHTGFLFNSEMDPTGKAGTKMKEEMQAKIEKWQEPPPAKQPKPLPVPDLEPKKRRGGRRLRKMKERYGMTDMRKAANRMNFNEAEEEAGLGGEGIGVLGSQSGSGKIRVQSMAQSQNQKLAAKAQKKFGKEKRYGSSGASSGLASSVAFTPIQGIELVNPENHRSVWPEKKVWGAAAARRRRQAKQRETRADGTESYFSATASFSKVRRLG